MIIVHIITAIILAIAGVYSLYQSFDCDRLGLDDLSNNFGICAIIAFLGASVYVGFAGIDHRLDNMEATTKESIGIYREPANERPNK